MRRISKREEKFNSFTRDSSLLHPRGTKIFCKCIDVIVLRGTCLKIFMKKKMLHVAAIFAGLIATSNRNHESRSAAR